MKMARILDKDTRLIDIDFGPLGVATTRAIGDFDAGTLSLTGNGQGQLLNTASATHALCGSFIQYERIDLDFMVRNNEIVIPVDASIQRTSPVPKGSSTNGNNFDQIEEYIYVFTRPLNNANLSADLGSASANYYELLRDMGLDRSEGDNLLALLVEQMIYQAKQVGLINLNVSTRKKECILTMKILALVDKMVNCYRDRVIQQPKLLWECLY